MLNPVSKLLVCVAIGVKSGSSVSVIVNTVVQVALTLSLKS